VNRREQIGEAGIRVIAARGVRGLTHRAIDTELSLAPGSTSYYARTKRDLITLIIDRLAAHTRVDISGFSLPEPLTVPRVAAVMNQTLEWMMRRPDEHAARFALLVEYRHDPNLLASLTTESPLRETLITAARSALGRLGVDDPDAHAPDLIGLLDSLLLQRVAGAAAVNTEAVLRAYLSGLPRGRPSHR
jgi:AcrR family transcriptional regulator